MDDFVQLGEEPAAAGGEEKEKKPKKKPEPPIVMQPWTPARVKAATDDPNGILNAGPRAPAPE